VTAFRARVETARGVDLTKPPFDRWRASLASKTSYAATQPLGAAMREAGVETVRYWSARDDAGGTNIALFTPRAFVSRRPKDLQTWHSAVSRDAVQMSKLDYFERASYRFPRAQFLVKGRLAGTTGTTGTSGTRWRPGDQSSRPTTYQRRTPRPRMRGKLRKSRVATS
jgi:RES domain